MYLNNGELNGGILMKQTQGPVSDPTSAKSRMLVSAAIDD